jgi:hypothetical protein
MLAFLLNEVFCSQCLWYCGQQRDSKEKVENYRNDKNVHRAKLPPYKPSNDGGRNRDQPCEEAEQPSPSPLLLKWKEFQGHGVCSARGDGIKRQKNRRQHQRDRAGRESEKKVRSIPQRCEQIDDALSSNSIRQSAHRNAENELRYNCSARHYAQKVLIRSLDLVGV